MSFYPVFRLLNCKTVQDNQFMTISCIIFVSPKCIDYALLMDFQYSTNN